MYPSFRLAHRATLVIAFSSGAAAAQTDATEIDESAPSTPHTSMPQLLYDPGAIYPKQALKRRFYERVEVVLIIEVDESGKVRDAQVETPRGHDFDQAALRASGKLVFQPALRGTTRVPARIRFMYVFEPPASTLVGRVLDANTQKPVDDVVLTVRSGEVEHAFEPDSDGWLRVPDLPHGRAQLVVESDRYVAQQTDVELIPGEETQVTFRLLPSAPPPSDETASASVEVTVFGEQPAPGVASYSREEVRRIPGAFGDPFRAVETLPGVTPVASGLPFFYVRGAPPGNVGYYLDGIRVPYLYHLGFGPSVIQPALVDAVDLHAGGYPARLGRFAGGIVAASSVEPRSELHGEGNLRLFDVGGLVESSFDDGRGSMLLGGRYSYTAALLSLIAPDLTLDYRDYQARVSYDVTPKDRLSVFSFGSYDLLGQTKNEVLDILFGTEFYRVDTRYHRSLDHGYLRTAVTLGYDRTSAGFLAGERRNVVNRSLGVRSELIQHQGEHTLIRGGVDVLLEDYSLDEPRYSDPESPETQDFEQQFQPRTDLVTGAWLDLTFNLLTNLQVTPGLRADVYRSGGADAIGLEPRLAARWAVTPDVRIVPTFGIVHQPPSFALPVSGLVPTLQDGGLQRSVQTSTGVEADLDTATMFGTTLFYSVSFNMTDAIGAAAAGGAPDFRERSDGRSYGAEVSLRRRMTRRLGGFLSYTLSRSERSVGEEHFPSAFDRTHVLNLAASYGLGRGWTTGGRFVAYSGAPVQLSTESNVAERTTTVRREQAFFRLDFRLEKRWTYSESTWLSFVAEVMNATLNKETFGGEELGPIIIPSLGLEAGF